MQATLNRANYPTLNKADATKLYRRRYSDHVLRYSQTHEWDTSAEEQLFAALDELTDEELEGYLRKRRARRNSTTANVNVDPWVDRESEKVHAAPNDTPRGTIGTLSTALRGSIGGSTDNAELGSGERGKIGGQNKYSKEINDKALKYCKDKKALGQPVSYEFALSEFAAGNLRQEVNGAAC